MNYTLLIIEKFQVIKNLMHNCFTIFMRFSKLLCGANVAQNKYSDSNMK